MARAEREGGVGEFYHLRGWTFEKRGCLSGEEVLIDWMASDDGDLERSFK